MLYSDFERFMSNPRMAKYCAACGNDSRKAMTLYRSNIRLSNEIFAILSLFEVALRNAIDAHYRKNKGTNWLLDSAQLRSGFLHAVGCERSLKSVEKVIADLGANYTPDEAIAQLTFGFWMISSAYAAQKYYQILELLQWLGIDARQFLYGIDGFRQQKELIDSL